MDEGSIHSCSHLEYAIIEEEDEDLMGSSSSHRSTEEDEDDGPKLDNTMPDSSSASSASSSVVGVLHVECRNMETTPVGNTNLMGDLQPGHQRRSTVKPVYFDSDGYTTSASFLQNYDEDGGDHDDNYWSTRMYRFAGAKKNEAEEFARRRSTTFLKNIDFVQEQTSEASSNAFQNSNVVKEAEMFARRRSTTFLKNIEFVQGQTESFGKSSVDDLRSSATRIIQSVDFVQEQAETVTRSVGHSFTTSIDYAQEQAELFTKFLATNVFGQTLLTTTKTNTITNTTVTLAPEGNSSSTRTLEDESAVQRETAVKRDSVIDFVERRVDTFTRNVKHVEEALRRPQ